MKKIILFLFIALCININAQEVKLNSSSEKQKEESLVWLSDLNEAIPLSINSKKTNSIIFYRK
jgi:hypothetical protein